MKDGKTLRINGLARELSVSVQTIKNYETQGVLPKPRRDPKGWRYYTSEDIIKIKALYGDEITHSPEKTGRKKRG